MGIIGRLFRSEIEKAAQELAKREGSSLYDALLKMIGAGNPVMIPDNTDAYIKQGYLFNPIVYSIVSFIAQKASGIPWYVYKVKDEKAARLYKSAGGRVDIPTRLVRTKALEEIPDHPMQHLFDSPNNLQGWSEFIEQVIGFKLITGNSYVHTLAPDNGINKGIPREFWCLPSQIMKVVAGDGEFPIRGYKNTIRQDVPLIPYEEMIHLKYWTPEYASGAWLYGLSPIKAGRRVISRSNSSYDTSVAMIQNSGVYGMLTGDAKHDDQTLTPEQAEMVERKLRDKTTGANKGKTIVTSAALKWQQMGMSPVDLAILEADKVDLRMLCAIYHVPSELFGDAANKTYSNSKEAGRAVYTNAVIPALSQFRDALNGWLKRSAPDSGLFIDFDVTMIPELQPNMQELVTQLSSAWWLTPNEKREVMSWGRSEDVSMDEIYMPMGNIPISMGGFSDDELAKMEKELGIGSYI